MIGSVDPVGTTGGAAAATCRRAEIGTLEIEDMPSIGSPCCDYRKAVATVAANASGCATTTAAATTAICTVATGPTNAVLATAARATGKLQPARK